MAYAQYKIFLAVLHCWDTEYTILKSVQLNYFCFKFEENFHKV